LLAGAALGQGGVESVRVSGLLHTGLGQAHFESVSGRLLTVSNIGSSGQDGVSIHADSLAGVAAVAELGSIFNTPGSSCRVRVRGWDATTKGRVLMTGSGGGRCVCTADFTTMAATRVHWTVKGSDDAIIAEGETNGATLTCSVIDPLSGGGGRAPWRAEVHKKVYQPGQPQYGNKSIQMSSTSHTVTILGLTPVSLVGVRSIEFTPIVCITSPCPGDWTNIATMDITASGVPTLDVSNAALESFSWGCSNPSSVGPGKGGSGAGRIFIHSSGGGPLDTQIGEVCDDGNDCDSELYRRVTISGPGPRHATVDFDPDELVLPPNTLNPTVTAYKSATLTATATPGGSGARGVGYTFKQKPRNGIPAGTYINLNLREFLNAGGVVIVLDGTYPGSDSRYTMFAPNGTPLHKGIIAGTTAINGSHNGAPGSMRVSCDGRGEATVQCPPGGATFTLDGVTTTGVGSIVFSPVNPQAGLTSCDLCEVDGLDGADMVTISSVKVATPAFCGGLPVLAAPGVTCTPVDSTHVQCVVGEFPNLWVETRFDSPAGGGLTLDLAPLLAPGPQGRGVIVTAIDTYGNDGARLTLASGQAARTVLTTYDDPDPNVTGVDWEAHGPDGAVIGGGSAPASFIWVVDTVPPDTNLTCPLVMSHGDASSSQERMTMFFSEPVGIAIGGGHLNGVASVSVQPRRAPGAVARAASAARVVAVALPGVSVSDVCGLMFDGYEQGENVHAAACSAVGTGLLRWKAPELNANHDLDCTNIGSSGNDGVRIGFTVDRDPPNPFMTAKAHDFWAWHEDFITAPQHATVEFRGRCNGCYPGTVTIVKLTAALDPTDPTGPLLYTADATGTGPPAALHLRAFDASNHLVTEMDVSPTDAVRIPRCAGDSPTIGCGPGGVCFLQLPAVQDACYTLTLSNGATVPNIHKLTWTPVNPTPFSGVDHMVITAAGLDRFTVSEVDATTIACPADLGVQGGGLGQDGHLDNNDFVAFIECFFTANPKADLGVQGGGAGHDGHFDNNDFVAFIDFFFTGC
jgi:hypothetical protein